MGNTGWEAWLFLLGALGQGSATPRGPGRVPTKRALRSQAARTCVRGDWPRDNRGGSPPTPQPVGHGQPSGVA